MTKDYLRKYGHSASPVIWLCRDPVCGESPNSGGEPQAHCSTGPKYWKKQKKKKKEATVSDVRHHANDGAVN